MVRPKRPSVEPRRQSSTLHYQTFPTKPPTSRGRPPSSSPAPNGEGSGSNAGSDESHRRQQNESPLPTKQLAILAVVALAEQTAFNSISPYLPEMASTFPEVSGDQVGLFVGLIASAFASAQFTTNFFWGWLSDRIGRKPVILLGTLLSAACFVAFGFCRTLWQAILVQILLGLVNGNQGVVSTCLGEITDRSNQSKAFTYLPVVYGIGAITGPAVGGLLVFEENPFSPGQPNPYPYLLPNLFAAGVLLIDLVLTMIFMEESLEQARELPPLGERLHSLFAWMWQFTSSSHRPTDLRRRHSKNNDGADDRASITSLPTILPNTSGDLLTKSEITNCDTILLLATYFIFQLSNVAYNSLYPIFGQAPEPNGRDLTTEEIGLSLAFAGVITILFQVVIYGHIRDRIGNKATYRVSIALFIAAFLLMPWVGYKDKGGFGNGKVWLWIELGLILVVKTVASIGGLTSALLLVGSPIYLKLAPRGLSLTSCRSQIPHQTTVCWGR
jgi:MFS family permease